MGMNNAQMGMNNGQMGMNNGQMGGRQMMGMGQMGPHACAGRHRCAAVAHLCGRADGCRVGAGWG